MNEGTRRIRFSPENLLARLRRLPACTRYWVAYSGGCDSHALLYALAQKRSELGGALAAVHVNHNLQPLASHWAQHCASVCAVLQIPLHLLEVDATPTPGESPEAAARRARYGAIASILEPGDGLITAHHQDDQAETVLLQLLRGGGPHGLAAMPAAAPFARATLLRPLLGFARAELVEYARELGLQWVDDPTNFDTGIRRNYLRHEVMPRLATHWPAAARSLTRAAGHFAEAAALLDAVAREDMGKIADSVPERISIAALRALDAARQRNVLRFWIQSLGLPLPEAVQLHHVLDGVLPAADDATPVVRWPGAEVRRYRDHLYAMQPLPEVDRTWTAAWDMREPLPLPDGTRLRAEPATGTGLLPQLSAQGLRVAYRQGGEACRPRGGAHRRPLKKLLQEYGIPPWQRERLPLVLVEQSPASVAGLWYCEPWGAKAGEAGMKIVWEMPRGGEGERDE